MRLVSPLGWRSRKADSSGASSELAWWRRQGTIARRPSTRRSIRRSTVLTAPSLVVEQRQDVAFRELAAAVEEAELDDEREPGDLGAETLDQADGGGCGATGGEDVVDHQHPLVDGHRVAVQLQKARAVLQLVGQIGRASCRERV